MTQIRIICLSHPKIWITTKEKNNIKESLLGLTEKSFSWASRSEKKGTRNGIFRKPYVTTDNRFIVIPFVWEKPLSAPYQSLESLLDSNGKEKTESSFHAAISKIIVDAEDGVAYIIDNSRDIASFDKIRKFLERLSKDTTLSFSNSRLFAWDKKRIEDFASVAMQQNFVPHKVRGATDLVHILAEGDLINDEEWNRMQNLFQNSNWSTIAFLHNNTDNKFVFSLIKSRNIISVRGPKTASTDEILVSRVNMIRDLFEKTLGTTLSNYCFAEYLDTDN